MKNLHSTICNLDFALPRCSQSHRAPNLAHGLSGFLMRDAVPGSQHVVDIGGAPFICRPLFAERRHLGNDVFDHYPLAIQTADPRAAASLRDLFYLLGGAVYLVKLKSRTFLRLAGILPSDPSRIGHHPAQFLFDLLRQIREKDRIIITLAHLSPIEAREPLRLRQKHLRLGENRAVHLVKAAYYLSSWAPHKSEERRVGKGGGSRGGP